MRIAIVGSRRFKRLDLVSQFVFELERDTVVISGGAAGVDTTAIDKARRLHMPYEVYPSDWNKHGRRAGAIRNRTIVEKADEVVAFWNGKSNGTQITIEIARELGKPCRIITETT